MAPDEFPEQLPLVRRDHPIDPERLQVADSPGDQRLGVAVSGDGHPGARPHRATDAPGGQPHVAGRLEALQQVATLPRLQAARCPRPPEQLTDRRRQLRAAQSCVFVDDGLISIQFVGTDTASDENPGIIADGCLLGTLRLLKFQALLSSPGVVQMGNAPAFAPDCRAMAEDHVRQPQRGRASWRSPDCPPVTRTCQLQQLNVLAYLTAAIACYRRRQTVASLLPKRPSPLNCYDAALLLVFHPSHRHATLC